VIVADFVSLLDALSGFLWALSKLVWSIRRPP
jgi:hypothetical protein